MDNAIEARFVRCKMLTDGTLRIEIEIDAPKNVQEAFRLICEPNAALAIVRLNELNLSDPSSSGLRCTI